MSLLDYLKRSNKKSSAAVAKERLQIILAHEHAANNKTPDYLPTLQRELLEVVRKYAKIDVDDVKVTLGREGDCEIIELNISLPEQK